MESQAGIDFLGLRCSRLWPEIENLLCISVSWHPCVPIVLLGNWDHFTPLGSLMSGYLGLYQRSHGLNAGFGTGIQVGQ